MSAIGGIVDWGKGIDRSMLAAMIASAPGSASADGAAWNDRTAGLLHVALATTPEAAHETQPYRDPRSGMAICFDGRINNRDEVRALIGRDAPPANAPDCTIVLAAWQRMGEHLLDRLVGDYAFGIWSPAIRQLVCARSPVGWRPLLWTTTADGVAFATEPAMLIRGLGLPREIDEGAIGEFLSSRFVSETDSFWKGVQRLPPGYLLTAGPYGTRVRRWLEGPFEDFSRRSDGDHIARFNELFDQALIAANRSSGPVAAHLSGGLDSSSIICRSHQLVQTGAISVMPRALSARFPGEQCDEGKWIAAVEAQCGIRSQTVVGARYDWSAAATWSAQTLHLPLRPNTTGTIIASCERLRADGVSVLLNGEGGDDWLSGDFAHFPDLVRAGRLPTLLREGLSAGSGATLGQRLRWTISSGFGPLVSDRRRSRLLRPHLDFASAAPAWISPDWARQINLADRWRQTPSPPALANLAQQQRYAVYSLPRRHVNADNVLCYAASRGVELRSPLHDFRLTRFLMGAAGGMLRRNGVRKHLLREAMRGTLPELVRQRDDKANMSVLVYDAVADRLRDRPIAELSCVRAGWVDATWLKQVEAEHAGWRANGAIGKPPLSPYNPVWSAVAIDLWLEQAAGIA
jgi:asparagine synthase (glutamine-hydrolysing)